MRGGLVVNPGDIAVGDADGIVVVNPADAPDVLKKAQTQNAKEAQAMKDIENLTWARGWGDEALKAKGREFIEQGSPGFMQNKGRNRKTPAFVRGLYIYSRTKSRTLIV